MIGYVVLYGLTILILFFMRRAEIRVKNMSTNLLYMEDKAFLYLFSVLYLIFLIWGALRGNVSVDIQKTYLKCYENIAHYGWDSHFSGLFNYLTIFVIKVFKSFQWFLAITTFIYITLVFISTIKLSISPAYTILLFVLYDFYYGGLNQIRQYVGVGFFCIALIFLSEKKYIASFILITLATMSHSCCAFLYMVLFYDLFKASRFRYIVILALSPLLYFFIKDAVNYVFTNFDGGTYSIYVEEAHEFGVLGKVLIPMLKSWGLMIFYLFNYFKVKKIPNYKLYMFLLTISCVLSLFGSYSSEMIRMVYLFLFPQIFFIPSVMGVVNDTMKKLFRLYILFIGMFFIYTTYEHITLYPYEILKYIR